MSIASSLVHLDYPIPPSRNGGKTSFTISSEDVYLLHQVIKSTNTGIILLLDFPEGYGREHILQGFDFHFFNKVLAAYYSCLTRLALYYNKPMLDTTILLPPLLSQKTFPKVDFFYCFKEGDSDYINAFKNAREPTLIIESVDLPHPDTYDNQPIEIHLTVTDHVDNLTYDYERVAVGGTFDHLHGGHKVLLSITALMTSHTAICAVSGDALLVNKKYKEQLESESLRMERAREFMELFRPDIEYKMCPLHDMYGPTVTDPLITALVVSLE
eukprot:Ihof_evm10s87 gene=Ihof_evmTU10s87